ncbi:MAG TPA: ParB/RepB/Spo0J family partition protein [Planctomycetota bacterium]|nr:ParB/RepB/Spo0J family partition protein [Planctomycetota bacterium]
MKFEKVPLHLIDVDPRIQLRAKLRDSSIDELAASAKKIGILHPVHVERKGHRFRLIMGHRRFVAARRAGMTAIDAFVVERRSDEEAVTIALSENVLRENLSPLGVGLGCLLLSREHAWSYAELSELIGISLKSIQRRIRVADRASPAVKAALHERSISNAHALAILRLPSEKQEALLQEVLAKGFPSRETERRVKETLRSGREEQRAEIVKEVGPLAPYARAGRTNRADEHELAIRYHSLEELLERLRGVSDRLRDRSGLPVKTLKPISARPRPKSGRSTTRRKSR